MSTSLDQISDANFGCVYCGAKLAFCDCSGEAMRAGQEHAEKLIGAARHTWDKSDHVLATILTMAFEGGVAWKGRKKRKVRRRNAPL